MNFYKFFTFSLIIFSSFFSSAKENNNETYNVENIVDSLLNLSKSSELCEKISEANRLKAKVLFNGEERAIVVTGEMEKYFPMDIFPMQLIKA